MSVGPPGRARERGAPPGYVALLALAAMLGLASCAASAEGGPSTSRGSSSVDGEGTAGSQLSRSADSTGAVAAAPGSVPIGDAGPVDETADGVRSGSGRDASAEAPQSAGDADAAAAVPPAGPAWTIPVRGVVNLKVEYQPVGEIGSQTFAWYGDSQSLSGPGVTYYLRGGTSYACTKGTPAVVCVEAPPQDSSLAPYDDVYRALSGQPGLASMVSESTAAGRAVVCAVLGERAVAAVPSLSPGTRYTACLDRETGLVLTVTSEAAGVLLEADAVAPSTAQDVKLPAPPLPLPVD